MPRAFDRGQATLDKDPNRFGTDFNDPFGAIAEGAQLVGDQIRDGLVGVINDITGINLESVETLIASIGGVFGTLIDWLTELVDLPGLLAALEDLGVFFTDLVDRSGFLTVLSDVVGFFTGLIDRSGFLDVLQDVIGFFTGLLNPTSFLGVMEDVVDFFTGIVDRSGFLGVLQDVVEFFSGLLDRSGFLGVLEDVVGFFSSITTWSTWSTALKTLIDGLLGITNFSTWTGVLKQVVDFFTAITSGVRANFLAVFQQVVDAFAGLGNSTVIGTFLSVFTQVINFFGQIASGLRTNFLAVFQQVVNAFVGLGNSTVIGTFLSVFTQVVNFFGNIASGVRTNFLAVFQQVVNAFVGLGNSTVIGTFLSVFTQVVNFFGGIASGVRANFLTVLQQVIDFFVGIAANVRGNFLTVFEQVNNAFVGLGNSTVIGTFLGVFTQVVNFFGTIASGARGAFLTAIQTVIEFFQGIISRFGDLNLWIGQVPLIGPLYWFLSGKTPNDDGAPDLSSIGAWARGLLDRTSQIPADNLVGFISKAVLGVIPVSSIGLFNPNLLEQFGFEDATTVDAADGWTWDETTNRFGSPAGAARLTLAGTSGVRELFYNQDLEVVAGDKLQVSGFIKTSSYNGNSTSIVLSLVPFIGTVAQTPIVIGARGASTPWVQIVGSTSSNPVTSPWTVPTAELAANQITGVRVRLAVNADATAGIVWWDDISLTKQGLLGQSLVDRLLIAWQNLFNGLFGTALDPTARTVDDVLTAADSARLSIAGLQSDVTQFLARNANNNLAGRSAVIDFSSFANATSLGDGFVQVYTGSGGGTLGVSAGQASWLGETLLESRNGWARYRAATGAPITASTTATDYQKIGLAFSSIPNTVLFSNGFNFIIGRSNAWTTFAGATFVYLKLGLTVCELRYVVNGVDALLKATPVGFRFRAGATYYLECGRSDMDAPRIYRALENGTQIFSHPDGSNLTQVGANFRGTGFGASNTNPFGYPGRVSAFAYYDNTPAPTRGSGFRRYRGATNVTLTGGAEAKLPSGFFTESDIITDDITYTTAALDPNRVTVSVDGWYAVELRLQLETFIPSLNRVGTVVYLNNGIYSRGTESIGTSSGSQRNASGTHLMYLRAGDYLQPGYHAQNDFSFTGNAQGTSSYFSITFLGNKKPEA